MNIYEIERRFNEHIRNRTPLDVVTVYEALKAQYPLTLTNAFALENGEKDYTDDFAMVCGASSAGTFQLYDNGLYGVFEVDKADGTYTHWHPAEVGEAIEDVKLFMRGICKC